MNKLDKPKKIVKGCDYNNKTKKCHYGRKFGGCMLPPPGSGSPMDCPNAEIRTAYIRMND